MTSGRGRVGFCIQTSACPARRNPARRHQCCRHSRARSTIADVIAARRRPNAYHLWACSELRSANATGAAAPTLDDVGNILGRIEGGRQRGGQTLANIQAKQNRPGWPTDRRRRSGTRQRLGRSACGPPTGRVEIVGSADRQLAATDARGRPATAFIAYMERNGRAEAAGPKTRFFGGRRGGAVAPGRLPSGRARRLTGPGWAVGGSVPAGVCRPDPGGSPASGAGRSCRVGSGRVGSGRVGSCRGGEWSLDGPGRTGVLCCRFGGKEVASGSTGAAAAGRFRAIERIAWMRRSISWISSADSRSPPPLAARPWEISPNRSANRSVAAWGDGVLGFTRCS